MTGYQGPQKPKENMGNDMKILGVEEFTESNKIWRMLCAEFLGAFSLLFFGCGTIMNVKEGILTVQVALTFGLCIAVMAQSIGHVSGCHINPAVTLSFLVVGKCSILKSLCYIVLQCAGAAAGFYVLLLVTPHATEASSNNLGNTSLGKNVTPSQGLVVEIIATFLLCFVIHSVCDERRSDVKMIAPLLIGISAVVCHLFAIDYTGSSLNPARSFGPTVVYGKWTNHWVYWAGPIIGGCVASIVYKLLFQVRKGEEETSSYDFS
ncbi:aquaporin AQPAn.G isoform X2 [Planococcus citri]|uniref:aquaporin AQPAn.G isoform X2 n=1 Tax=Planococcus citri TaxID=170843 RepID=UPI0031F88DBD